MAHITANTLYEELGKLCAYYIELENRELSTEENGNIVYEDEYNKLKKMYNDVMYALKHIETYTKKEHDQMFDLMNGIMGDIDYFMHKLEESAIS